MSCAGSKTVESSKGFECRNMGDVLGKECEKEDSSLSRTVEDVLKEDAEGAESSGPGSESDSEKDLDSDEDLSWLLPINTMELGVKNCKCEGCSKLFESYSNDKKNAKLLLSSWKEFRNYLRNVYINPPPEAIQKNENISFEDNERLHEIVQVMRLCDPYQLFQKIENEVCSMVLESRIRQLNMLKDENNPTLAEEFIAGLIEEYVKLLSSALQLSPAIENLLGPQLQRFGLTWEVLNKQLYRSLVYNHFDVQQNLIRFIEQLRKMLPLKDDIYHELVHQYLALDGEMTLIGTMWKNVEPLIQEYRNLKSKESEKLNSLLDAMKDFFANKLCVTEEETEEANNKTESSTSDDIIPYCPNCMTKRGCPCDECTVTHMMSCEDILLGMESPSEDTTPSRSRSPSQNTGESKESKDIQEQQSCECHACTMPPPDLMDCSVTFSQITGKKTPHGEDFQLYPHIHGRASETENMASIYGNFQATNDSVYPHLYNLHSHSVSVESNTSQINNSLRDQLVQAIVNNKLNSQSSQSYKTAGSPPPPPPPPPPSQESTPLSKNSPQPFIPHSDETFKNSVDLTNEKLQELATVKNSIENNAKAPVTDSKTQSSKPENEKSEPENNSEATKERGATDKATQEKAHAKPQGNSSKANGCVISGLCGKCCLKHGSNCLKMSGCNKGTEKHLAAIARLGLSGNSNSRAPLRCSGGKEDHVHRTGKSHSCNKTKHHENAKKVTSKRNLEVDEAPSLEDSCSESSNLTSVSGQKDPRHCDCCYCEVFGHGVPSVGPVNRNYQEMRERLRLRLNMKKSANCKTLQPGQKSGTNAKTQISSTNKPGVKNNVGEQDLETVLQFIEGKKSNSKDAKKAAKRARQKQKKQEEKERQEEEEREKKRLEAVKRQVTISLVNNNKRSQNAKPNPQPTRTSTQSERVSQPQTLNLSGLKSLVEKSDPNAIPKMVTIRRVMAPFSNEPTVTITLKGSTPDKDKVLFMLKNGTETGEYHRLVTPKRVDELITQPISIPVPMEDESCSKKSKKAKKKAKQKEEIYEEECESSVENVPAKKKKKKNKQTEVSGSSGPLTSRPAPSKVVATESVPSKRKKSRSSDISVSTSSESQLKSGRQSSNSPTSMKIQNQNAKSQPTQKSKTEPTKNNTVLKNRDQEPVNKTANKTNSKSNKNSAQQNSFNQANSVSSTKESARGAGVNRSAKKGVSLPKEKNQNSNNVVNQKVKNGKSQSNALNGERENLGRKQKNEIANSFPGVVESVQSKSKTNSKSSEKSAEGVSFPESNQTFQNSKTTSIQEQKQKCNKPNKNKGQIVGEEVEVKCKITTKKPDNGKVIINTPSYRLSEVLSSIAPSPPPKEEINLENLRLPPGITITKIEGPIQKPVKPPIQPTNAPKPAPPIIMAPPTLKSNPPPGNVIVVDTGRLKEVVKENSQVSVLSENDVTTSSKKKKKKKNKKQAEMETPTIEVPINQSRFGAKLPKNCSNLNKRGLTVLSSLDARKMVPNLENQQATIIKTSDNMVTIRSPALQQAMNLHAYQNGSGFKPGINGYSGMSLFNEDVSRINEKIGNLQLGADANDRLTSQMRNMTIKDENRTNEMLAQAMMAASSQSSQGNAKKKKKKKKQGKSGEEREVEPVESVFQPKDIDLENGDIDDDERELEAFKRFCLQSIPPERKNKVKVNLNIKDIVLKKKSSAIGCS